MQQINWRNVITLSDGGFDCEIDHPEYGWIPFTASPNDVEPHGRQIWEALKKAKENEQR